MKLALLAATAALTLSANAAVVFSETFSVDGALNGQAVSVGTGTWNSDMDASGGVLDLAGGGYLNVDLAPFTTPIVEVDFDLINGNTGDGIVMLTLGGSRQTSLDFGGPGSDQYKVWMKTIGFERPGPWSFDGYANTVGSTVNFTFTIDRTVPLATTVQLAYNGTNVGPAYTVGAAFDGSSSLSLVFHPTATGAIDNLSVNAIPEPSTYAAIAGALALGLVAYRRRK